jgi:hypothetical protein
MIEALLAVVLTLTGAGLLVAWRSELPSAALGWLSFPVGAAAYLLISLVMIAVVDRTIPWLALVGCGLLGGIGSGVGLRRGIRRGHLVAIIVASGATFAAATAAWFVPLTRLTIDSGEYLLGAAHITSDGATDLMAPFVLKRQMALQALHALSISPVRGYVAWVSPVFGVAVVGLFAWLTWTRLEGQTWWRVGVIGGLLAFLATSSRFFYDFFYVHSHMVMAAFLFIAVAGAWLAITEGEPVWAFAAGLGLAVTLLVRAEAPALAAVVLVAVAATRADRITRRLVVIPSMVTVAIWYGGVLWGSAPGGDVIGPTEPVFSSLLAILGAGAVALVVDGERFPRAHRLAGRALVPAVAAGLLIYAVSDPILLRDSVVATFRNQKRLGWWVTTWAVVVPLAGLALLSTRIRLAEFWGRIVVAFGLLFFTFPYLRGSPWRVGPGDSGNRMLAHFLLIVLAFVVLTFGRREPEPEAVS